MSSSLSDPINPKSRLCQRSATCTGWSARLIAESLTWIKGFTTKARGKICHYCVSGYTMVYSVLLGILAKMTTQQMKKHDEHHWKPLKTIENHWILGTQRVFQHVQAAKTTWAAQCSSHIGSSPAVDIARWPQGWLMIFHGKKWQPSSTHNHG